MTWLNEGDDGPWSAPDDGEDWAETEEQEEILEEEDEETIMRKTKTLAEVASKFSAEDFLVVRLYAHTHTPSDIADETQRSRSEVCEILTRMRTELQARFTIEKKGQMDLLIDDLEEYGHNDPCPRCKSPLKKDHTFCLECGVRNPYFHLRYFKLVWGNSYAAERREECQAGHPRAKALEATCFCHLCGTDLQPITAKGSE